MYSTLKLATVCHLPTEKQAQQRSKETSGVCRRNQVCPGVQIRTQAKPPAVNVGNASRRQERGCQRQRNAETRLCQDQKLSITLFYLCY